MAPSWYPCELDPVPVPLREKAELRLLVEKDERFALTLEKTNKEVQQLVAGDACKKKGNSLNILASMMWRTVKILWEIEDQEEVPKLRQRQKVEIVMDELHIREDLLKDCRRAYLKELSTLRDRIRVVEDPAILDDIYSLVYEEDPVMYYEPLQFVKEERIKMFVAEVVEEKLKLIMTRWSNRKAQESKRPSTAPPQIAPKEVVLTDPANEELALENEKLREQVTVLNEKVADLTSELQELNNSACRKQSKQAGEIERLHNVISGLEAENRETNEMLHDVIEKMEWNAMDHAAVMHSLNDCEAMLQEWVQGDDTMLEELTSRLERQTIVAPVSDTEMSDKIALLGGLEIRDNCKRKWMDQESKRNGRVELCLSSIKQGKLVQERGYLRLDTISGVVGALLTSDKAKLIESQTRLSQVEADLIATQGANAGSNHNAQQREAAMAAELAALKASNAKAAATEAELRRECERLNKALEEIRDENKDTMRQLAELRGQLKEMKALNEKQAGRIKELEKTEGLLKERDAEIRRLHLIIEELNLQIAALQEEMGKVAVQGDKERKRIHFPVNFKQTSGRDVFARLYRDALDRLARMEYLRQRFIQEMLKLQRPVYQSREDLLYHGAEDNAQFEEEMKSIVLQTDLEEELNLLGIPKMKKKEKVMPRTFAEFLKIQSERPSTPATRAKQALETLYPGGISRQIKAAPTAGMSKKSVVPLVRPRSTASLVDRERPRSTASLVDREPRNSVVNRFRPQTAQIGHKRSLPLVGLYV